MTINPQLMIAPSLEEYFVDKESGLPLAAGEVYFWQDAARTIPQPVYALTGSPPNYTYTQLPNPMTLSAVGTFVDGSGNDIKVYYFPFTGTPSSPGNQVSLYYITVYNSGGQFQWARQAWPNFSNGGSSSGQSLLNYIPNGQFVAHNNIPANPLATPPTVAGQVTKAITSIGPGGWTFERPSTSNATDIVTFTRDASSFTGSLPTGSPRYTLTVNTTVVSTTGDVYKDVRIKFSDVNKFSSVAQQYTLYFEAQNNGSGSVPVSAIVRKFFGTSGSPPIETVIGSFSIGTSYQQNIQSFTFGTNQGYTVGPDDDDYLKICFRFPVSQIFNATLANFILVSGQVAFPAPPTGQGYPYTTTTDYISRAVCGELPIPDYYGNTLFLHPVNGPNGLIYDETPIGDAVYETAPNTYDGDGFSTTNNRLLAIGKSYVTSSYSPIGIPMRRLFNKYWLSSLNIPAYGTGADYVTALNVDASFSGLNTELLITTNAPGSVSNTVDGVTATGFTIATTHTGANYNAISYTVPTGGFGAGQFYIETTSLGGANAPTLGNAGAYFDFALGFSNGVIQIGNAVIPQIVGFQPPSTGAAGMTAGQYIFFSTPTTDYYIWWKINGGGSDPAIGGRTGIEVDLDLEDTQSSVGEKIREALNGWQQTTLKVVAGSSIPAGAYFRFFTTASNYSIWYSVNGSGSAPNVSDFEIEVAILSTDTIQQVIAKTVIAMNGYQYATPDYRGLFLRNVNLGGNGDPDAIYRFSLVPLIQGDQIGTFQNNQNQNHAHMTLTQTGNKTFAVDVGGGGGTSGTGSLQRDPTTGYSGGAQSNPNNASVNIAIIY